MSRNSSWNGMHWIRDSTRYAIYFRDRNPNTGRFRCLWCGKEQKKLELDHLLPVSKGGNHSPENLVSSCHQCNHQRLSCDFESWCDSSNFSMPVYQRIKACLDVPVTKELRKIGFRRWLRSRASFRSRKARKKSTSKPVEF